MGRTHDEWGTLSRERCFKILNGRDSRKLCNNTYLELDSNGDPSVRLWGTRILTFKENDVVVLDSGGYETATTRNRFARYSPYRVHTYKDSRYHGWTVYHLGRHYRFENGMEITPESCSTDPVELELFQDVTGIEVKTVRQMEKAIGSLDQTLLQRLYKKAVFIADVILHAPMEFLPLLIGRVPEDYMPAFESRLREGVSTTSPTRDEA